MKIKAMDAKGFTLIELLIVIAILGILAAIAWPPYQRYRMQSGRSDARASLMERAQQAERFFVRNSTYANAFGVNAGDNTFFSAEGLYTIVYAGTATGFTLTATPRLGQTADTLCSRMIVNSLGQRTARDAANNDTSVPCW